MSEEFDITGPDDMPPEVKEEVETLLRELRDRFGAANVRAEVIKDPIEEHVSADDITTSDAFQASFIPTDIGAGSAMNMKPDGKVHPVMTMTGAFYLKEGPHNPAVNLDEKDRLMTMVMHLSNEDVAKIWEMASAIIFIDAPREIQSAVGKLRWIVKAICEGRDVKENARTVTLEQITKMYNDAEPGSEMRREIDKYGGPETLYQKVKADYAEHFPDEGH